MMTLHEKVTKAKRETLRSVIRIAEGVDQLDEQKIKYFYGVKDTEHIPEELLRRLQKTGKYALLTIDKAADKGRAIDTDLINPITYRAMTGSTSGGPINIIKGINDFAIGTDGGGSILAPALSCQLPSIIGAGLQWLVTKRKKSTDGITFTGSVGVIGKNLNIIKEITEVLIEDSIGDYKDDTFVVAIPKHQSVMRPDGKDMHEEIMKFLKEITTLNIEIVEVDMKGISSRKRGMEIFDEAFSKADFILTYEGPVDIYGYGETIPTMFGPAGKYISSNHGKFLVRSANIKKTTAITIPTRDLASGLVLCTKAGVNYGKKALYLAIELQSKIKLPEVWRRYFIN